MARITQQASIRTTGTSYENEPIIKSDGASSNVMQWLSNNEGSNITISEDDSNNLDLVVSSGNVGIGVSPTNMLAVHQSDTDSNSYVHLTHVDTGSAASDGISIGLDSSGVNGAIRLREAGALKLYTSNTEHLTISSAGNVLLGTGDIQFTGAANATIGHNGYFSLELETNGLVRQTISADGLATFANGINLGNTVSATATTLDGYEEGTWTASLSGTTATIGNATGNYVRIGSLVWVSWYSSSTTFASSVGDAVIHGLPFANGSALSNYTAFTYQHGTAVDGDSRGGYFTAGGSTMTFVDNDTTSTSTFIDGSGKYIMVSGVYQTTAAF